MKSKAHKKTIEQICIRKAMRESGIIENTMITIVLADKYKRMTLWKRHSSDGIAFANEVFKRASKKVLKNATSNKESWLDGFYALEYLTSICEPTILHIHAAFHVPEDKFDRFKASLEKEIAAYGMKFLGFVPSKVEIKRIDAHNDYGVALYEAKNFGADDFDLYNYFIPTGKLAQLKWAEKG